MTMRRRVAVMLATVLAGAALSSLPAQAVPGVPSPIFDPNSVSWLSLRDQTSAQFTASFAAHSKTYLIDDLDIDTTGGSYRVGSVWQLNIDKRGWKELRDLDDAGFHAAWTEAKNQGMRLTEQETYLVGGAHRYAGVWVQNVENLAWASFRGLTSAEFSTKFAELQRDYRMLAFESVRISAGQRYAGIWVETATAAAGPNAAT
jgi:hypothetical protein